MFFHALLINLTLLTSSFMDTAHAGQQERYACIVRAASLAPELAPQERALLCRHTESADAPFSCYFEARALLLNLTPYSRAALCQESMDTGPVNCFMSNMGRGLRLIEILNMCSEGIVTR